MLGIEFKKSCAIANVDGKLIDVDITHSIAKKGENDKVEYAARVVSSDKKSFVVSTNDLYPSVDDFRDNIRLEFHEFAYTDELLKACHTCDGKYAYYVMGDNGKAERIEFDPSYIEIDFRDYPYSIVTDVELPSERYLSEDDVYMNNYVEHVQSDGKVVKEFGYALRVALTDEQREVVKTLEETLKKLSDMGVAICNDNDSGLYAINFSGMMSEFIFFEDSIDEDYIEVGVKPFKISGSVSQIDDYTLCVDKNPIEG